VSIRGCFELFLFFIYFFDFFLKNKKIVMCQVIVVPRDNDRVM